MLFTPVCEVRNPSSPVAQRQVCGHRKMTVSLYVDGSRILYSLLQIANRSQDLCMQNTEKPDLSFKTEAIISQKLTLARNDIALFWGRQQWP